MNSNTTEYLEKQALIRESRKAYKGNGAINIVFISKDTLYELKQINIQGIPQTVFVEDECEILWGARVITTDEINNKYEFVWANQYELEQLIAGEKIDAFKNLEKFIPDFKKYLASR